MRKILVLGGAGYIGSHTCKRLRASGFDPITFDNLTEGYADFVKWGDLIVGDIANKADLDKALKRVQPDAVIHFAAFAYVGESVTNPSKYYENNTVGSLRVAQALRDAGNIPLIFSSTCATYGVPASGVISETSPTCPINPYGRSKLMVEQILEDFSVAHDLRSVRLRYFNAAGADPENEIGEAHRVETHLIPRAILAGLGHDITFSVFGDDYETKDGSAVRDYIHVNDLADAHVAACRYLLDGGTSETINLGVDRGYSVLDIVKAVEAEIGRPVPYSVQPRRAGDPPSLIADPTKARELLGFKAQYSDLDNIIKNAVAWHRRNWSPRDQSAISETTLC